MSRSPSTRMFLYGVAFGVLLGGAVSGLADSDVGASAPNPDAPPTSVTSSGPSCFDGPRENTGWMHVMANGESWAVTLNATVVHPPGTEIAANVSRRQTGTYEIALQTVPSTPRDSVRAADCRLATDLNVATALSEPDVSVVANGRTVRSVAQDETTANLYPIPNPVNATAG